MAAYIIFCDKVNSFFLYIPMRRMYIPTKLTPQMAFMLTP